MKLLFLVLCLIALYKNANSDPSGDEKGWRSFKSSHQKTFSGDEDERKKIYLSNVKYIEDHNKEFEAGKTTFKLGANQYADLKTSEFSQRAKGLLRNREPGPVEPEPFRLRGTLPESLDYRTKNMVSPVQDQGSVCGSCYSFAANGAIEGQIAKKKSKIVNLSEQNIVDCSQAYGNYGCGGGFSQSAFKFVKAHGIALQKRYPYTGRKGQCKKNQVKAAIKLTGFKNVVRGDEAATQRNLVNVGPLAIAVDASKPSFQFYKSGVYFEPKCKNGFNELDHAVLLVGYGTSDKGEKYWIIKNSWGTNWGISGYMHLARGRNNHCGVATDVSYPTLA